MIITVIGNDSRQRELARLLNKHYDTIYLSGDEEIKIVKSILKISDTVILPLPMTRDNKTISSTSVCISDIENNIPKNAVVFAGGCKDFSPQCKLIDYNEIEEFTLKNALYTAEAAIALAVINTPFSLSDAKILIMGNGRIGKFLTDLLSPLCKSITVSARKQKDFDFIRSKGHNYVESGKISDLSDYNVIFNTIPEKIIEPTTLLTLSENTLIVDLASKNSGLYSEGKNYIDAKALPAKYCKMSTAEALFDSVSKYL